MYSRRPTSQVSPEDRKMPIDVSAWDLPEYNAYMHTARLAHLGFVRHLPSHATLAWFSNIIHIRRRHVSFSILIGQTSVAEWLIVASINHKNSNQK